MRSYYIRKLPNFQRRYHFMTCFYITCCSELNHYNFGRVAWLEFLFLGGLKGGQWAYKDARADKSGICLLQIQLLNIMEIGDRKFSNRLNRARNE